jgi:carbamoyl-phosphate synthase large subunit
MNRINILVTGGGSPGIAGTIYSLRNNFDYRDVRIICTDAKENFAGIYLSDNYYKIPKAIQNEEYLKSLVDICIKEKIDVILPQNTAELELLANNKKVFLDVGTKIVVSDPFQIKTANNKYYLLQKCKSLNIPYPEFFLVRNKNELINSAKRLGWPQKPFVIKPPASNGSRGIRIIDENKDYKSLYYNEKPTSLFIMMDVFIELIGNVFEPLLVMEYLPGDEITVDVFRMQKKFLAIPRIREEIRSGISFANRAENNVDLISYSKTISDSLDLKFCFGFQFKYDSDGTPKILECNPRVQGTMIFSTFMGANIIYAAVKSCLEEPLPEFYLDWDAKLIRYWGAIGITNSGIRKV